MLRITVCCSWSFCRKGLAVQVPANPDNYGMVIIHGVNGKKPIHVWTIRGAGIVTAILTLPFGSMLDRIVCSLVNTLVDMG